jgi:outer membrane protein assembly factor BamB
MPFGPWPALGGDWPMWRYDAARSAVTPEEMPETLHLQWVRELGRPEPAWPTNQQKLQFDATYEPVVQGETIFVPSMVSDRVTAYDTETGLERWRFYTDGPVRFAPVAFSDKVAFISDDGYLYCVRARDGALLWKLRGGPSDRRILGNDRLISMWPARGGPVVQGGTIYFAASIWPFMGTFIYAVEGESGRVIWDNTGSGSSFLNQQHSSPAFAGVAPQGYFTVKDKFLLISGGRSVPAAYDRATGHFLYYEAASRQFGKNAGGYGVTAVADLVLNGKALYDLKTGKGLVQVEPGLATADTLYSGDGKVLTAGQLPPTEVEEVDRKGKTTKRLKIKPRWKAELAPAPEQIFLKAGERLYGSRKDGTVMAIDLAKAGEPVVSWQASVKGTPQSMLAAGERLFVVTSEGHFYCYAAEPREGKSWIFDPPTPPRFQDAWIGKARQILDRCGTRQGYCLVLGIGSGRLIDELISHSEFHIIAVDPDPGKVEAFRIWYDRFGYYGRRVAIMTGDPFHFPFPPYLATLAVSEDLQAAGLNPEEDSWANLFEALRPYGGMAVFSQDTALADRLLAGVQNDHSGGFEVSQADGLIQVVRPGPLAGAGSWTHQYGDAANTVVSKDRRVKTPLGLLWFGGPSNEEVLPRHGHGPSPQVVGGRLFIEGPDMLRAVDVFTGRLLWQRQLPNLGKFYDITSHQPGANEIGGNHVSVEDGIYVMFPHTCLRLDPATGVTLNQFTLPAPEGEAAPRWGFISAWKNLLVATASPIAVSAPTSPDDVHPEEKLEPILTDAEEWQYLAGTHPPGPWTTLGFDDSAWKTGAAGFGYEDDDDKTVLDNMKGEYQVVYLRQIFEVDRPASYPSLHLGMRYDDAFIAYLNGQEVLRVGVEEGNGQTASHIRPHEALKFEFFEITNAAALLRRGQNVLAIEGHNDTLDSSDFSLDPWLGLLHPKPQKILAKGGLFELKPNGVAGLRVNTDYASGSGTLVVLNRHSGDVLWSRPATYSFRHNAIAIAAGKVFCLDTLTDKKVSYLQRRGWAVEENPALYALDAYSGKVLWEKREKIFGTWLGYSEEHDILLQAGSYSRDRAKDEVRRGLAAYRGTDGALLWQNDEKYDGPCMLHHDTIITQGAAFDLRTGKRRSRVDPLTGTEVPWSYIRNYGCNTVVGSEYLLTFRSAAAGYFDLANEGGTGNLGGFRSGCTTSLIVADGLLNAPDYTHTCICSYQNQTSLALIHMPEAEIWTFNKFETNRPNLKRVGLNFGAPGDRKAEDGTLWVEYPIVGGPSPKLSVTLEPSSPEDEKKPDGKSVFHGVIFRHHSSRIQAGPLPWVAASGLEGVTRIAIALGQETNTACSYNVRLCFAELDEQAANERVFSVTLQGREVLQDFNVAREAGGPSRSLVKEFHGIEAKDTLDIRLTPARPGTPGPIVCGVEIIAVGN